jgi:hypothetical protein
LWQKERNVMAKPALKDCEDAMPSNPEAPKTVAKKATSARGGSNSFIKGGKGKGKGKRGRHKRHVRK